VYKRHNNYCEYRHINDDPDLPQPVPFSDGGVTANGIVLVRDPHDQYDVECCRGVVEEL
jgi:hypothetical protein